MISIPMSGWGGNILSQIFNSWTFQIDFGYAKDGMPVVVFSVSPPGMNLGGGPSLLGMNLHTVSFVKEWARRPGPGVH